MDDAPDPDRADRGHTPHSDHCSTGATSRPAYRWTNSKTTHGWNKDIEQTQGAALNFPLIADADRAVSNLYDMIHPNASDTLTVRSVFVIGGRRLVASSALPRQNLIYRITPARRSRQ